MNSSSALLDVQNLRVSFSTEEGTVQVLKGLSYSLPPGKVLAVVGESGSGKTVHALSLLRLLPPTADIEEGHVLFEGKDLVSLPERQLRKLRGARISMIFQDPMSSLNPVLTVGEQLKETILAHRKISKLRAKAAAIRLLKKVGISDAARRYDQYPFQFSGGMCQRAGIAVAMLMEPPVPAEALMVKVCASSCQTMAKGEKPDLSTSNLMPTSVNSTFSIVSISQSEMACSMFS